MARYGRYRVWAALKSENPRVVVEVEAASEAEAICEVMAREETIAVFGGTLPLFGAELVYCRENVSLLAERFGNVSKAF